METIQLKLVAEEHVIEAFKHRLKASGCTLLTQSRLVPNQGDSGFHTFVTVCFVPVKAEAPKQ